MTQISCILIGEESLLVGCGDILRERGHAVAGVVSRNPAVRDWATARGLPLAERADEIGALAGPGFDWLFSIANLTVIPDEVLALPRAGAINFHDGPLPAYAGLNTPVWALLNGEAAHGVTWHLIEGGIDEGDILWQQSVEIAPDDTAFSLNSKCYGAALEGFGAVLGQLEAGALERQPQDLSERSYYGKLRRPLGAGRLDFARPAEDLARALRALDFGGYWNPLCSPRVELGGQVFCVGKAEHAEAAPAAPGTVLDSKADRLKVATSAGALVLSGFTDAMGRAVSVGHLAPAGSVLASPDLALAQALQAQAEASARTEDHWRGALKDFRPLRLPLAVRSDAPSVWAERDLRAPQGLSQTELLAALAGWCLHNGGDWAGGLAFATPASAAQAEALPGYVSAWLPLSPPLEDAASASLATLAEALGRDLALGAKGGFAADLVARDPGLSAFAVPAFGLSLADAPVAGTALTLALGAEGGLALWHDTAVLSAEALALLIDRLEVFLRNLVRAGAKALPLRDLLDLPERERDRMLVDWNQTRAALAGPLTLHDAFEAQADRTPEATALVFDAEALSYAELDARANRLAHRLIAAGAQPGDRIGLYLHRSLDLMIGALAILKAGAAYVPLDPAYPSDRIGHYVTDSAARLIVTQAELAPSLPASGAQTLLLDAPAEATPDSRPGVALPDDALAYVIYTSGSTGTPKGVMVEHRNVANFFTGMDARIDTRAGGVWLAVTSLGFDISVLELFYTLARGFKVVLVSDENRAVLSGTRIAVSDRKIDFGLMYWGNDDGAGPAKYRLLLEGAKFADANGFNSVWTPERHFHAFGGPFPNPSVTGAAVAAVTSRVSVRSGSVVAPLHHPARIAEEWAVIDNLCNGRAGLGIASGWHPDDFVLRPENTPPGNRKAMFDTLEQVRRLWRGEAVDFPTQSGGTFGVVTQPRPVSKELAVWVTTAGNPDTWREAGEIGANVLTHLLGQSIEEVGEKIKLYHNALRAAGHDPADFTVTLMLHTYLAEDRETAAEVARGPMKAYLTSAAGLIKQYAWAFPAFKRPQGATSPMEIDLRDLDGEAVEAILDFAFERYFEDSGLFGTVEDAVARAEQLKRIGVDEIACLIDYGIPSDLVLEGLTPLAEALKRANQPTRLADDDFSISAQIIRHDATHMQCTPSMARLIAADDQARVALGHLRQILLGGEALDAGLADDIEGATRAELLNMYGPTETTIWSSVHPLGRSEPGIVPIGKPLANTALYVLDAAGQPVPVGLPGELHIGGLGVARGYWQREELTAERFVPDPFAAENGLASFGAARMYRSGDLVRWRVDGTLEFLGRTDHQVKIRGQRIELGEIEARIARFAGVRRAVVVPRTGPQGDTRLVAYIEAPGTVDSAGLRADLAAHLPEVMVPAAFVTLEALPLTPNRKIDRKALPEPVEAARAEAPAGAAPETDLEQSISAIWSRVLGVSTIRADDSFFALGGHSLLAVQAHRQIKALPGLETVAITDIFRFPILRDLAGHLGRKSGAGQPDPAAPDSGAARGETMSKRREMRARRSAAS